jgi:hypothetical protein
MTGFLVTFRCGDVQHFENAPRVGGWSTHWSPLPACQATSRVITVEACPGCEHCQADNSKARTA